MINPEKKPSKQAKKINSPNTTLFSKKITSTNIFKTVTTPTTPRTTKFSRRNSVQGLFANDDDSRTSFSGIDVNEIPRLQSERMKEIAEERDPDELEDESFTSKETKEVKEKRKEDFNSDQNEHYIIYESTKAMVHPLIPRFLDPEVFHLSSFIFHFILFSLFLFFLFFFFFFL